MDIRCNSSILKQYVPGYVFQQRPFRFSPVGFSVQPDEYSEYLFPKELQEKSVTKFLEKPFEPSKELRESSELLARKFLIKQRRGGLRRLCQYLPIILDIFLHAEDIVKDEVDAIAAAKQELKKEFYFLNTQSI